MSGIRVKPVRKRFRLSPKHATKVLGMGLDERAALETSSSRRLIGKESGGFTSSRAPSGEVGYRVPEDRRAFLSVLPLPKVSLRAKTPNKQRMFRRIHAPPKPLWHDDLDQASLYSSVLKYTAFQLTDERLYLPEAGEGSQIKFNPGAKAKKEALMRRTQEMQVVQPAFKDIAPDESYHADIMGVLPERMREMMKGLEGVATGQLPHPALAMFGEALLKSTMTDFITDMLPRIQSKQLDKIIDAKMSLSSLVNAASRCGIARGLGYQRELHVYNMVSQADSLYIESEREKRQALKNIERGSIDEDVYSISVKKRRLKKLQKRTELLTDAQHSFMEERMKLTVRHLLAFLSYACFARGEGFVKGFVVRYLMPDLALQYFSDKVEHRAWLEANNRWKFLPSSSKGLVVRDRGEAPVPVVVDGEEVGPPVIAGIVDRALKSKRPVKELEIVITQDQVAREMFRGARPQYRLLYTGHTGFNQEKVVRVGVFVNNTLLAEGEGFDMQAGAEAAAQQALLSYYLNPRTALGERPRGLHALPATSSDVEGHADPGPAAAAAEPHRPATPQEEARHA